MHGAYAAGVLEAQPNEVHDGRVLELSQKVDLLRCIQSHQSIK